MVYSVYMILKRSVIMIAAIIAVLVIPISSVSAGGPRLDWPEDSSHEGKYCWVQGYDAGFAGKYDKGRADECANEERDEYNRSWDGACKDAGYTKDECEGFKNNPVDIKNHESLQQENRQGCFNDGYNDGKADNPFNRARASGCSEYGGMYRNGYKSACQLDSTESSCELLIQGHESYCPNHPDITACVEYLREARGWAILVQTSSVLKKAILKDIVSTIMIQPFVKQLEIFVMQTVL